MNKFLRYTCLIPGLLLLSLSFANAANKPDSFTFVVFGDNHGVPPVFKIMLRQMNDLHPAFAVNTGDCTKATGNLEKMKPMYARYTDTVKQLFKPKVYLTMGNHEIWGKADCQDFYVRQFGKLYQSFNYGNSHFIILDSELVGQTSRIIGTQLEWLKADLRKAKSAKHIFVFMHKPMYPVDGHKGFCIDVNPTERDALHRLFVQSHVTAVFTGHEHLYNRQTHDGITYIISGGAGGPGYPAMLGGMGYHFMVVTVKGGDVTIRTVKPDYSRKP